MASVSFPPTLPYTCVLRLHTVATPRTTRRPNELDNDVRPSGQCPHVANGANEHTSKTALTSDPDFKPVRSFDDVCLLFSSQLLFPYSFDSFDTARPWFRCSTSPAPRAACGLRGRAPPGRRRRATVHAPTAFIMERTQSPVSSSWDTSDSTEPKPRLQSTITTATTTSEFVAVYTYCEVALQ